MIKKTSFLILLILLIPLTLFFCGNDGEDGKDGTSYAALSWLLINSFGGFDAFPNYVVNGQYYQHDAGIYTGGWYVSWDDSYWTVSYTIKDNSGEPGEKGGWFSDGEDGADGRDKKYTIELYSTGPYVYSFDVYTLSKSFSNSSPKQKKGIQGNVDLSLYDLSEPIKMFTISTTNQDVIFTVEYKQYKKRVDPE